jgi:hypothetical protein
MKALSLVIAAFFITSCASVAVDKVPALENRSLFISKKVPGFEYPYRVCTKTGIFGRCRESEIRVDYYDLTDPLVRDKLIDMGFVGKVRDKVLP